MFNCTGVSLTPFSAVQGIINGACRYAMEYSRFAPDWDVAATLRKLCGNMQAGIWHAR